MYNIVSLNLSCLFFRWELLFASLAHVSYQAMLQPFPLHVVSITSLCRSETPIYSVLVLCLLILLRRRPLFLVLKPHWAEASPRSIRRLCSKEGDFHSFSHSLRPKTLHDRGNALIFLALAVATVSCLCYRRGLQTWQLSGNMRPIFSGMFLSVFFGVIWSLLLLLLLLILVVYFRGLITGLNRRLASVFERPNLCRLLGAFRPLMLRATHFLKEKRARLSP